MRSILFEIKEWYMKLLLALILFAACNLKTYADNSVGYIKAVT